MSEIIVAFCEYFVKAVFLLGVAAIGVVCGSMFRNRKK